MSTVLVMLVRCLIGAAATVLMIPAGASACECSLTGGVVVASGKSPHHVPWHITAYDSEREFTFGFAFDPPGYPDAGYSTGLSKPLPPRFVLTADMGSGLDPFPESDISGVTVPSVAKLVVKMSRGHSLRVRPRTIPDALRAQNPWLPDLKVFDRFFAAGRSVRAVTAFDGSGRVVARKRARRGLVG